MATGLDSVIDVSYSIRNSIKDVNALLRMTKKQDAFRMRWTDWGRIRKLYVLGSSDFREIDELRDGRLKPGYYLDIATESELLVIGAARERIREHLSRCGENLETLSLHFTTLEELEISHLTGVKELDLSKNEKLCRISGMDRLARLWRLNLSSTRFGPVLDLNPYSGLERININGTPIREVHLERPLERVYYFYADSSALQDASFLALFPGIMALSLTRTVVTQLPPLGQISQLEYLFLSGSGIRTLPQIEQLTHLEILCIDDTSMEDLEDIRFPERLEWLDLGGTSLRRLPPSLRGLEKLNLLNLTRLQLEALPDWFPELLERDISITLFGTTVEGMEAGFLQQPKEMILQWFREREKAESAPEEPAGAPLNEIKVVFLGDGEAGKSHTIARLLNDGGEPVDFNGDSTPGIVITHKTYDIGGRQVQVHFWDFGGQEILHSMHRMFLTERTLYVVLINARDDTQDDRARYWLHNVKSFAGGAPVLLVLNKMDQNPNASINETDLRDIYPGLTEVVKLSAMFDGQEKFNANFTEAMKRQIGNMKNLDFFFPASWTMAKKRLLDMEKNYISGRDYAAICDECAVSAEGELRMGLLNWFNDLGVSICYSGSRRLRDYVILRPNWITNAIYAILFNKHPQTRNGIISHDAIFEMIQPPKEGDDPYRRTDSAATYTEREIEFILNVTRKFRLSFRVDDDCEEEREFVPMLCPRKTLPVAAEYEADRNTLEFRMVYEYLPNNVIHRLMVELRQHLDRDQVWLTGALFRERSKGFSAVVKTEGNLLRIFVRAEKERYTADMYLDTIRSALERISAAMNLKAVENQVVYKADGIVECFDYDELLLSQDLGDTMVTSRVRRRKIPIADVLNQTDHRVDRARTKLVEDVLSACRTMQANKLYWDVREDDRNTYIRDLLRKSGYHVFDQTLCGISAGGKQAGELDLEIRREKEIPWTIFEALNLSGEGKAQIAYWDGHLKKLLDNYNAYGLPFLLHVSYVECGKDQFSSRCAAYTEHLRFHSPDSYSLQFNCALPTAPDGYGENHFIQAHQCVYDCDGFPTTVYHIFVRMGA